MMFPKRKPMMTADVKRRLKILFKKTRHLSLAYLYGSSAIGKAHQSSDIDIAVLFEKEPDPSQFVELSGKIMAAVKFPRIDIVLLNKATPLLKYEVIKNGVLLYSKNQNKMNEFEMNVFRVYFDTKWMRERQNRLMKEAYGL